MNHAEKPKLRKLLAGIWALRDKPAMPDEAFDFWWRALGNYTLPAVAEALQRHVNDPRSGVHMPMPADILRRMDGTVDGGWLEANEAWALCPHGEDDTVVWCDEIRDAYHTASELLPDRVAARMAFIDAYRRLVESAKLQGKKPWWSVSLGHDPVQRQVALDQAVRAGRITQSHSARLSPARAQALEDRRMLQLEHEANASGDEARIKAMKDIKALLGRTTA